MFSTTSRVLFQRVVLLRRRKQVAISLPHRQLSTATTTARATRYHHQNRSLLLLPPAAAVARTKTSNDRHLGGLVVLGLTAAAAAAAVATTKDRKLGKEASTTTTVLQQLLQSTTTTNCDSTKNNSSSPVAIDESTSFQVMTALDQKDEVQRIRLAQILHDLHHLAQSYKSAKIKRQGTMRRLWKFVQKPFDGHNNNKDPTRKYSKAATSTGLVDGSLAAGCDFDHLSPKKALELIDALSNDGHLDTPTLVALLMSSIKVLRKDDTLVDMRELKDVETISVVGDLHGSLSSLNFVLDRIGDISSQAAVIFDGDFVDRGNQSLEVLCILLLLKLAYPDRVVLLRGNHEDILVSSAYGFQDELMHKYGPKGADELWDAFHAVFCALPLVALTDHAAILHGGLPSYEFTLDDVRNISTNERCRVQSIIDPVTEIDALVQGLLWSDPRTTNGIAPNTTRTIGVFYGPDVVSQFLKSHDLTYLIRGHEVVENGADQIACGDGRSVLTVFSHSEYPNGYGSNLGAFVQLDVKSGEYDLIKFSRQNKKFKKRLDRDDPYVTTLKTLIGNNKHKLERTFESVAPGGEISAHGWIEVMSSTLNMPDVPWPVLLPSLVPDMHGDHPLNWRTFLQMYSSVAGECQESKISMEILHANHDMLMAVFKFLDFNGNGTVDASEFKTGVELLNKRLPHDRQLQDPDALFKKIDKDGNGEVCLEEFAEVFKVV